MLSNLLFAEASKNNAIFILAIILFIVSCLIGAYRQYCLFWKSTFILSSNTPFIWYNKLFRLLSLFLVIFLSVFSSWWIVKYFNYYPLISLPILIFARWFMSRFIATYFYKKERIRCLADLTTYMKEGGSDKNPA